MYQLKWNKAIVYDEHHPNDCVLEICEPITDKKVPLLIYFHGGGLCAGSYSLCPSLETLVQQHGIAVASVEYRKYPLAVYPDFIVDSANAIAWLDNIWKMKEKYSSIFVGGSSAGGYLSMMLCFAKQYLNEAGVSHDKISGWIFDAGQPTSHFQVLIERGMDGRSVRIDEDAPLWHITESFANQQTVPILIIAADHDMVNRLEQNVVLKTALEHFDYPSEKIEMRVMEGYKHCQYINAMDADGRYVYAELLADFICRRNCFNKE